MRIGIIPVNVGVSGVDSMIGLARKAEAVGVESLWTFEHVIVPNDYNSKYPYSGDGKMGVPPETNFVDPLIALAAIARETSRVRLGTGVNILPQTNPLLLAKQTASLDFVSNGRFMLGVGIGWLREEYEAMGTPFERRGARFDDYIEAMRKVWSGETVEHESEHLHWTGFKSYPLPIQKPLPLVIGGSKGKAFERIARHGQGWFAPTLGPDQLRPMLESLTKACDEVGRDPAEVEITSMWIPAMGLDHLHQFADLGVARLIVPVQALGGNPVEALDGLADDVLAKL